MNLRMTLATLALGLGVLAACGTDEEPPAVDPSPGATSPAPETEAPQVPADAQDLAGEWSDPKAEWTVRFSADGTFSEDFQGVEDFRAGDFTVQGDTVTLVGGDGNSTEGTIEGDMIVFRLGTLTRN